MIKFDDDKIINEIWKKSSITDEEINSSIDNILTSEKIQLPLDAEISTYKQTVIDTVLKLINGYFNKFLKDLIDERILIALDNVLDKLAPDNDIDTYDFLKKVSAFAMAYIEYDDNAHSNKSIISTIKDLFKNGKAQKQEYKELLYNLDVITSKIEEMLQTSNEVTKLIHKLIVLVCKKIPNNQLNDEVIESLKSTCELLYSEASLYEIKTTLKYLKMAESKT